MRVRPRRRSTFLYHVAGGGSIRFSVRQVAPVCRAVGSFTVRARAGVNRLRFSGHVRGHRLRRGTYVIRARRGKATVFRKILVVGKSSPGANVCAGETGFVPTSDGAGATGSASSRGGGGGDRTAVGGSAASPPRASGVLGAHASKVLPGSGETQLGLVILLAGAIFLLGLGALPRHVIPHPAAAAFLAHRRTMVAASGLAALAVFIVSYLVI